MSDQTLHKCAGRFCPGYEWPASRYPHPLSCLGPVDDKTVPATEPWPTATDAPAVQTEVAAEVGRTHDAETDRHLDLYGQDDE